MGNSIGGGRKRAKVMNVKGEVFKLKTPVQAWEVVKDYPGHMLMDAAAVKHFGIRAQAMEPHQELKPKKVYFLVELPKFPDKEKAAAPRRVRSGINMSAKDRLECLALSRRSVSDLASVRPSSGSMLSDHRVSRGVGGSTQVKLRIPKAQLDRLVEESTDGVDVAEKILDLYMMNSSHHEPQEQPSLSKISQSFRGHHHHHQKRVSFNTVEEIEPRHLPPLIDI